MSRLSFLVLMLMSSLHLYNCSPVRKEGKEGMKNELIRLLNRIEKKIYNDEQSRKTDEKQTSIARLGNRGNPCGQGPMKLTASSGTVRSPGYDQSTYDNDAYCSWLIEAPAGNVISATMTELQLESCFDSCYWDFVTLYDGSSEDSDVLHTYCTSDTSTFTSTGSFVLVVFQTDKSVNSGRFSLSWTFAGGQEGIRQNPCGGQGPLKLTASSGTIKSPGYDQWTYDNDAYCSWLIEAPPGNVISATMTELELESYDNLCYWDYVTLYDGQTERSLVLYTYCIPDTTVITSTGSSLLVVFRTDVSANYGRFSFSWTFVFNGEVTSPNPGPFSTEPVATRPVTSRVSRTTIKPTTRPPASTPQCGRQAIQPDVSLTRIVGGSEARPNSWPWQCLVLSGGFMCGGSVISSTHILTAAHCFYDDGGNKTPDSQVTVKCGIHSTYLQDDKVQTFTGVSVIIHEQYTPSGADYDITVIRLPRQLTFNDYVQPVCIPITPVADGTDCVIAGWGRTQNTGDNSVLRQISLPTVNWDTCYNTNSYRFHLTQNMICAGPMEGGKSSCFGDSGGPLVCKRGDRWYEYGIVSFGLNDICAEPNNPVVYASVVAFLPWIQQNARSLCLDLRVEI